MSIIEKAVGKLGEEKPADGDPEQSIISTAAEQVDLQNTVVQSKGSAVSPSTSAAGSGIGQLEASDKPVVTVPFEELHKRGMLSPAVPRSRVAEEYRTIKRPLLHNLNSRGASTIDQPNMIMVTSAFSGEGKTFSSINLALSIAMEKDKTVLFVDADTAKGSACRLLGVPRERRGLIDVLENEDVDLSDVILRTNIEKLSVLPAGSIHSHANELLASESMQNLMLEISQRYSDRVVVFDSPPLLMTTEAGVLANFMGQIVFIVAANSTPQHAVKEALERIGEDKVVGMVLNRARRNPFNALGYGYSYGYGYGYGDGRKYDNQASGG